MNIWSGVRRSIVRHQTNENAEMAVGCIYLENPFLSKFDSNNVLEYISDLCRN